MFEKMPASISTYGAEIDSIIYFIYGITAFFFIVLEVYLLYLIIRYRRRDGVSASSQKGDTWKQLVWILVPAMIVMFLDFLIEIKGAGIWSQVKENQAIYTSPDTVQVKVIAKQFDWTFVYPDKDGKFNTAGAVTVPHTLYVPVDRKIVVTLTSMDVIHSFFLPEVRLKQDIMPGREIKQWFEVNKTGTYNVFCSELCGFAHTRMIGALEVQDQKTFDKWLAAQRKENMTGGKL